MGGLIQLVILFFRTLLTSLGWNWGWPLPGSVSSLAVLLRPQLNVALIPRVWAAHLCFWDMSDTWLTCFVGQVEADVGVGVAGSSSDATEEVDDGAARVAQQRLVLTELHRDEHHDGHSGLPSERPVDSRRPGKRVTPATTLTLVSRVRYVAKTELSSRFLVASKVIQSIFIRPPVAATSGRQLLRRRKRCLAGVSTAHARSAWERNAASASLTKDGWMCRPERPATKRRAVDWPGLVACRFAVLLLLLTLSNQHRSPRLESALFTGHSTPESTELAVSGGHKARVDMKGR